MGIRSAEIQEITGIQHRTLQALFRKAKERGYDPDTSKKILDIHVKDAPRSGRPTKQTPEVVENVISKMDRRGREKTCTEIAREVGGISDTTVWRILRKAGYNKTKPTRKPGLTEEMKKARLQFALDHKDWTFEDWKKVIWSDETSIVIGHRRGGYRIWRRAEERWNKSCIRPRWKGYTEFQFWGCFSYDKRGPCHIWKPETAAQQKAATKKIEELNMELEPVLRAEWELNTSMGRLGLRNKPGKKPEWKWDKKHGKLERNSKGGIDWWRYCAEVVIPKFIPFAKECEEGRSGTIIQEDGASPHSSGYKTKLYSLAGINQLLWPGNSPDLNMIEPAWPHLKRTTTKRGGPKNRAEAERFWSHAWNELEQ